MARGRHRRRSGLLSRLLGRWRWAPAPTAPSPRVGIVAEVEQRWLVATAAETAAAALVRAARAEDLAALAADRALAAEDALVRARAEVAELRAGLEALREELVWAFAEGRLPVQTPAVRDLRGSHPRTA